MSADPLLHVSGLDVSFETRQGLVRAVDGLSLTLARGEVLGIVGESGSGKSVAMRSLLALAPGPGARLSGSVRFDGVELLAATERELGRVRGARIALVPQDAMSALDPVMRVGKQITEQIRTHEDCSREEARGRALALLERVGIPRPREAFRAYPHELSGGMRQRALIAMAVSCGPEVLIADEPTAALDVTIEAQVLELLRDIGERLGTAVILVTHDIAVVAGLADRLAVMYAGRIVEEGPADRVLSDPQHPYTWGLLGSAPCDRNGEPRALTAIPGAPPSLVHPPEGCHFRPRCSHEFEACSATPRLEERLVDAHGHADRCWLSPEEKHARRLPSERAELGPERTPA